MIYSGLFQRTAIITKCATLLFGFFQYFCHFWNMENSNIMPQQNDVLIFGIWNIPRSEKLDVEVGGIWNIHGIILKIGKTIKISNILKYEILYRILQKYIQKIVKQVTGA